MKLLVKRKFGPYRQSERKDLYQQYAAELINSEMRIMLLIQQKLWMQQENRRRTRKNVYIQSY
jgi:glutamyl/glutaminyl-tRNA synthetase